MERNNQRLGNTVGSNIAKGIRENLLSLRKEAIRESLSQFEEVEHRLEFVANIHGIEYVNDSKATNVNSTWYSLERMEKSIVWIVGGVDERVVGDGGKLISGVARCRIDRESRLPYLWTFYCRVCYIEIHL